TLPEGGADGGAALGTGETLDYWLKEIEALRKTIRLWDLAEAQDVTALARHIRWRRDGVEYRSHPDPDPDHPHAELLAISGRLIATDVHRPRLLEIFEEGDVIRPAMEQVREVVNKRLKGVSPTLLWNPERGRLEFRLMPASLL